MNYRMESDSIGSLQIPVDAYYGVQSKRGHDNFFITGNLMNITFIKNIVKIKKAAAIVNLGAKTLKKDIADAIVKACDEILEGKFLDQFISDAIQGGAGTTVNMNVNEVIANRASEILGGVKGEYTLCHPNDHVNMAQSTNDVIPTAGKLTVLELSKKLLENLKSLIEVLIEKSKEFNNVIKMGRTQLEDAVPIRLGQEFNAYASALKRDYGRVEYVLKEMHSINLGGSAIGTAVNVSKQYLDNIAGELSKITGFEMVKANDLIDATQNVDCFASVSSCLKTMSINLSKISNDLRLMSSGPKTGLEEITLPAMQNGSSIMPGKVNPVIPEVVSQVAFAVIGNDVTISMASEGGQLELNAFEPVIFYKLFESLTCLTNAMDTLNKNCIKGIVANKEHCQNLLDKSVGVVTALCPYIGYKKAAEIAKESLATNIKIRDLVVKYGLLNEKELDEILDPFKMTEPKQN